jgi:aconitate hydratase
MNYGQGSSREHAALAPRYLGLRVALVKDFARIHWQNLVNFGILPITFVNEEDYHMLHEGDILEFSNVRSKIKEGNEFDIKVQGSNDYIKVRHALTERQVEIILVGGMINWVKDQKQPTS